MRVTTTTSGWEIATALGTIGAAVATFLAIVFAWHQLRAERSDTQEALTIARQSLDAAREATAIERARFDEERRRWAERFVELVQVDLIREASGHWVRVQCHNRGELGLDGVRLYLVDSGVIIREEAVGVGPVDSAELVAEPGPESFSTNLHGCATFVDPARQRWLKWEDGSFQVHDGSIEPIAGRWWPDLHEHLYGPQ